MEHGEQVTGVPDENYDLISVLYHALEGAETYSRYLRDAESSGDMELISFLRDAQQQNIDLAHRARALLRTRISRGGGEEVSSGERLHKGNESELVDEQSRESFPASDSPGTY